MRRILLLSRWVLGFCGALAPMGAWAAPPIFLMGTQPTAATSQTAPDRPPTVGDLLRLQSQAQILALQVKIAKLKAELHKAHSAQGLPRGLLGKSPMTGPLGGPQVGLNRPRVRKVSGSLDRLVATIALPGHQTVRVRTGQTLPNGDLVTRITPHAVWVRPRHGQPHVLPWRAAASPSMGGYPGELGMTGGYPTSPYSGYAGGIP